MGVLMVLGGREKAGREVVQRHWLINILQSIFRLYQIIDGSSYWLCSLNNNETNVLILEIFSIYRVHFNKKNYYYGMSSCSSGVAVYIYIY